MTKLFKNRQEKGITLIALVVTIIVLLILAGISISMLTGENSILKRATEAKKTTDEATAKEQIQMEVLGNIGTDGTFDASKLKSSLEKLGATVTLTDGGFPLTVTLDGYMFTVDSNGNVKSSKGITLSESSLKLLAGGNATLTVSYVGNVSGTVTWSSDNDKVTVPDGKVTVASDATGTAKITATCGSYKATCDVTIVQKISSISATAITVGKGKTKQIVVTTTPAENVEGITYSYSVTANSSNASVDGTGTVTGVAVGSATVTITGTTESGETKTTTCGITVSNVKEGTLDERYSGITWTTLSALAKQISADTTKTSSTDEVTKTVNGTSYRLKVGDTKSIQIGSDIYLAQILGFNHDDLASSSQTGDYAGKTKAGISFQLTEVMTTKKAMNSNNVNTGGWAEAEPMYSYLNTHVYGNLETDAKNVIVTVGKKYMSVYNSTDTSTVLTSNDKLWLLSCSEIWPQNSDNTRYANAKLKEGDQYKYYATATSGTAYSDANDNLKKYELNTTSANVWWLRSPNSNNSNNFCNVYPDGIAHNHNAYLSNGVAFGFAI